ncbi:hypothetical protein D3C87_2201800 [compost metagenome]
MLKNVERPDETDDLPGARDRDLDRNSRDVLDFGDVGVGEGWLPFGEGLADEGKVAERWELAAVREA